LQAGGPFDGFECFGIQFLFPSVKRDGHLARFDGMPVLAVAAAAGFDFIPAVISDEFDDLAGVHGFRGGWLAVGGWGRWRGGRMGKIRIRD